MVRVDRNSLARGWRDIRQQLHESIRCQQGSSRQSRSFLQINFIARNARAFHKAFQILNGGLLGIHSRLRKPYARLQQEQLGIQILRILHHHPVQFQHGGRSHGCDMMQLPGRHRIQNAGIPIVRNHLAGDFDAQFLKLALQQQSEPQTGIANGELIVCPLLVNPQRSGERQFIPQEAPMIVQLPAAAGRGCDRAIRNLERQQTRARFNSDRISHRRPGRDVDIGDIVVHRQSGHLGAVSLQQIIPGPSRSEGRNVEVTRIRHEIPRHVANAPRMNRLGKGPKRLAQIAPVKPW